MDLAKQPDSSTPVAQLSVAAQLAADISIAMSNAQQISPVNPLTAYPALSRASVLHAELAGRANALHDRFRKSLHGDFEGPGGALGFFMGQRVGEGVSLLLQIERALSSLGATIDKKQNTCFSYVSMYVALIALILGALGLA